MMVSFRVDMQRHGKRAHSVPLSLFISKAGSQLGLHAISNISDV